MKIICVARNYAEHAKELKNEIPDAPVIFIKPDTAFKRKKQPFFLPDFSKDMHYETEIVLRICKNGKNISEAFANNYFDAVTTGIDFTARDLQQELKKKGWPWEIAKGFDYSAPLSKWIPLAELPNPKDIHFRLKKNGVVVQDGHTRDLIFPFETLIVHISRYFTLQKGDVIFTGTPAGVGPVQVGDVLEGEIEGRPMLTCSVR